jgi:hypothetical protein
MAVSWTNRGIFGALNQAGSSRITDVKVMASPAPTRMRAITADTRDSDIARSIWPRAISIAPPPSTTRGPNRSASTPAGTCIAAYVASCTTTKSDTTEAPVANRSVA